MGSKSEYLANARECEGRAQEMPPALRQTFVSLAAHWRKLASNAAEDRRSLADQKRQNVEKRIKLVDTRQPLPQIQKRPLGRGAVGVSCLEIAGQFLGRKSSQKNRPQKRSVCLDVDQGFRTIEHQIQKPPSITRIAAGAFGFLTLIQLFDGPER